MKSICFFNHYHNGDLFNSKSFIKEIMSSVDAKYYYAHSNHPVVLSDLDIEYCSLPEISHKEKFFDDGNTLYINTWIGCYFDEAKPYYGECTLRFSYQMFGEIYEHLNQLLGCNLKLSNIGNYFSFIDYSKFDCTAADNFLNSNTGSKVLFSNGPCLSGQCNYYGDMAPIIEKCAERNPEKIFIATYRFNTNYSNIKFTDDILNLNRCDLNEISYISKFCNLIVGRNSGPFCFSSTKENLQDPNKTFYAFGERETDCFCYGVDVGCNFIFEYFSTLENLQTSILELVEKV